MSTRTMTSAALILLLATSANAEVLPAYKAEKLPGAQDEAELWERASSHENRLRNGGAVFRNQQVEAYVESLSDRMLGDSLDHLGITIDFVLVADPVLSAWTYPYGTVGVHSGLLARMDNEAQFAAILAHELSHFMQRHSYREMLQAKTQGKVAKGLGFLAGLALAKGTGTMDSGVMDFAGDLWQNLATSGYSQDNEYVADEEGLTLMTRAGLPIGEALPAFQALAENSVYGAADPRKMWSSHPRLEDRLKSLDKDIKSAKRKKGYVEAAATDPLVYYRGIAPVLLLNARLDIQERQFERARAVLQKYLLVHPDNPEAHYLLGETHRRASPQGPDFSESQRAYQAALTHDSAFAPALKELGMTYRIQRQNAEARKAFEKYLAAAPEASDAGIVRAYVKGLQ
jgi:beta-barrel assembly-enhancing protease